MQAHYRWQEPRKAPVRFYELLTSATPWFLVYL
jgi:hypothetical protein